MIKFATALWFVEFTAGSESHSWAEVDGCVTQIWRAGVVVGVVLVGKFTSTVGFWFHTFVCWLSKDDRRWIQSFKHFDFSVPNNWEMTLNMNLAHVYQLGWNKTTWIQSHIDKENGEQPGYWTTIMPSLTKVTRSKRHWKIQDRVPKGKVYNTGQGTRTAIAPQHVPWPWIPRQAQAVEIVKNTVKSLRWIGAGDSKSKSTKDWGRSGEGSRATRIERFQNSREIRLHLPLKTTNNLLN